ncbi:hypothetical protein [Nonomuraea sp. LPB2021202275-12-8]|uniref:hypothetical protein n=1 Tax=Nonomuraea sp. LPB2021202275-12-8 TaxID=3120159 RepID=UPI00300D3AB8
MSTVLTGPTSALTVTELAQVLFASALQPSLTSSPLQVRAAIDERLCARGDRSVCAGYVAQEAGDHPEEYAMRMRWALDAVAGAYGVRAAA